jgi:hypothetical protein
MIVAVRPACTKRAPAPVRNLACKTYGTSPAPGEVEVRALHDVDLEIGAASSSCCSGLRAAARARC